MKRRRRASPKPYFREGRGWYANLRSFADVGGRLEALIPKEGAGATKDETEAWALFTERRKYYQDRRDGKIPDPEPQGVPEVPTLQEYEDRYFLLKEEYRASSEERARRAFKQLHRFPRAKDGKIRLDQIDPRWVGDLRIWSKSRKGRNGKRLSNRTRQLEETELSALLDWAVRDGWIMANPMRTLKRLRSKSPPAVWLEVDESVRLLDATREMDHDGHRRAVPWFETLLLTFLLTGGRKSEVFGLLVEDVDFKEGRVHFRPNRYRTPKTELSVRDVPLWSELAVPLLLHADGRRSGELLFPNRQGEMITDIRASLDRAVQMAKITKRVTWHTFRHTYTGMRLQTVDGKEPIAVYTAAHELGHSNTKMIEKVYGHVLRKRQRLPEVRYRPEEAEQETPVHA